jgi:glycerol-3-phosphate acyltransferase PlsY
VCRVVVYCVILGFHFNFWLGFRGGSAGVPPPNGGNYVLVVVVVVVV